MRCLLKRYPNFIAFLTIITSGILYILHWRAGHNWGGDFSAYIMQAMSIVNGTERDFLATNAFTINESSWPEGPILYPWGFPLLLAPIYWAFGLSLTAFKVIIFCFFILFLLILFLEFRKKLDPIQLATAIGIFAFNPFLLRFGDNILSDIPFLTLSTASIFLMNNLLEANDKHNKYLIACIIGLLSAFAYLIRTNGILIIASLVLTGIMYATCIRNNNSFTIKISISLIASSFCAFITTVIFIQAPFPAAENTHLSLLKNVSLKTIWDNLKYYTLITQEFFEPFEKKNIIGTLIFISTIPATYIGLKQSWRAYPPAIIYSLLTIILLVIWPGTQGVRFLLPIIPFYVYFFVVGSSELTFTLATRKIKLTLLPKIICVFFALTSIGYSFNNFIAPEHNIGPYSPISLEMIKFIKENTSPNEVIVFRKPRVMNLLSGRKSILYDKNSDFKYFDILVFDKTQLGSQIEAKDIPKLLELHPAKIIFTNSEFDIYRFEKS